MSTVAALQHLPAAERCKNWYAHFMTGILNLGKMTGHI
jgi:hypothetical protein